MKFVNTPLAERLLRRSRNRECRLVPHATVLDLGAFKPEGSKWHENVDRWCQQNPGHKAMRGWLLTGDCLFDRHSVVDRGHDDLLDITPPGDRSYSSFLPHEEDQNEFEKLPNQIIALDL